MILTSGEAAVLNDVFGTTNWKPGEQSDLDDTQRQRLLEQVEELKKKTRYPGTKRYWDSKAAYSIEILRRVIAK